MAKTMTASQMTDGQIDNAVAKFRNALRKNRKKFGSEAVQQVLGADNLGMRLLEPFRDLVEAVSKLIFRTVKVDRSLIGKAALDATGRRQDVDDKKVVATMPQGKGDEVELIFIKNLCFRTDPEVNQLLGEHGLVPADPHELAAFNAANPEFADDHPNATHWLNSTGEWCFICFHRWDHDGRDVYVGRNDGTWDGCWWFAGRRKPLKK